ncbi:hypothetical protein TWF106_009998 [Orbilia oligospora]|uniref:Ras-GAP domain-containing protein n=2 Tax=Orbilia oligospora TaxID=2813651 RepID=A0A7C8PIQ2_ORBOL|nr:hypothetical protein TWF788_011074 [Orbilia oligospora]KAF3212224.1 hypothetical protein TWF106_009998 [Orbilia oligospora]KAF3232431.1 hypothetical protein TWF191_000202 [Orbilia oligospora]
MTMMVSLNSEGTNGMIAGSTASTGRAFNRRPSSSNGSPERKVSKTVRRSQSATMSMNSLAQFRDTTIRSVPQDTSDDEIKKTSHPRSALSTPPRTPNNETNKPESRMNQFPISTRNATFAPTSHPQPLSNEKTIEYRTRARAIPHSPSSSTDETDVAAVAAPLNEISLNTSFQALRGRSPNHSVPSSPVPQSAPPLTGPSAQISTTIYASNGTPQRAATPKATNNAKLLKQRSVKKEDSNGAPHSIKTSDSISNLKSSQGGDASKVLNLMKELRGRMEGTLAYRIGDGMTWTEGFCTIQEETGRLTHNKDEKTKITVIGDLRGCQIRTSGTKSDDHEGIIEVSTFSSRQDIKLRPLNAYQYDCWLAALLCWQPIRPAGPNNKKIKTQPVRLATDRKVERRRNSDATVLKEAAIIKVGKMMLWDRSGQSSNAQSASAPKDKSSKSNKVAGPTWRRISCILQENGEFKLYNESDVALLNVVTLSSLSRSSIQYLDSSVLGMEHCIGIYPHASTNTRFQAGTPPIYLALDTKILFEVWFVLLRAYTVPELYGPAGMTGLSASTVASPQTPSLAQNFDLGASSLTDAFRVPRLFSMKIVEAKLPNLPPQPDEHRHQFSEKKDTEFFFELFIDGDIRARSPPRVKGASCMWMETFEFNELPSQLNVIEVVLKQRTVKHKRDRGPTSSNGPLSTYQIITGEAIGVITINLNDLQFDAETDTWWPILPVSKAQEAPLGEVMLRMRKEELVVLMMEEYKPLLELISNFSNGLTILISQIVNTDLRRLAHTLLKIFQVSGKAVDWLMALAEADVSGIYKDGGSKALPTAGSSAEVDVQLNQANPDPSIKSDTTKRAQMEANILFRGNSLLTKAVEAHMARYGKEYMEDTIGGHVKRIAEEDLYCEVDPMKCKNQDEIKQNWKTLNSLVRSVWQSIFSSGGKCPLEVKKVLYHIRLCVEEKFGGIISGPTYSSVSGFLFLRFFCPAIMNPKMFGLLKDHPGTRAQRTLTLVAKSLQGLANMSTFGVKEPWFENMNEFLVEHNGEFKKYIDSVSGSPPEVVTSFQVPPSYATPITIQARLQQGSKEGFPSLPFLIDQPRAIGRLVQMWLKWHELQEAKGGSVNHPKVAGNEDVLKFHEICLHLKERMEKCVEVAENAERPSSSLSGSWEAAAEGVTGSLGVGSVWESGSKEPTIGAGYTISSVPTPATPGPKQRNPSPGGGSNYTRAVSATNYKNGNVPQASGFYEDDHDLGNIAQLGKTKIVDFVGGIKKKVQAAKDAH